VLIRRIGRQSSVVWCEVGKVSRKRDSQTRCKVMNREPCLCVAESCNYEHGHDARPAMHHGRLAIPRCKYGFLHDPEDWICPRHSRPRRAKVLGSKANGRPPTATANQVMVIATLQRDVVYDYQQVANALFRRFGVALPTKQVTRVIHNFRHKGWVECRGTDCNRPIRLTELGIKRWASDG
jgi:hypothetical protein